MTYFTKNLPTKNFNLKNCDARVLHLRESTGTYPYQYQIHIRTLIYAHTNTLIFIKMTYSVPVLVSYTDTVPAPKQYISKNNHYQTI
jgi:hypothetical protein